VSTNLALPRTNHLRIALIVGLTLLARLIYAIRVWFPVKGNQTADAPIVHFAVERTALR